MKLYLVVCSLVLLSCKERAINQVNTFTTKTGKIIEVIETHPKGASLASIEITAKGFENGNHFLLTDVDPITRIELGDLDGNGFDELYIFTQSVGSGTYGGVIGYGSNNDKSLSPIYFPKMNEQDLKKDGLFEGYMGHDTFTLHKDKMVREYPIYIEGDINRNPTGGTNKVTYILIQGEASWQLKPLRSYTSEVKIVRNCSGTYIQYNGQDYKVCNEEILDAFENESQIKLTFKDSSPCKIPKDVAICMMYHPHLGNVEITSIPN